MGIAMAVYLMLLGAGVAAICIYHLLPVLFHIIVLGCAIYMLALGAVGFGIETGRIPHSISFGQPG